VLLKEEGDGAPAQAQHCMINPSQLNAIEANSRQQYATHMQHSSSDPNSKALL